MKKKKYKILVKGSNYLVIVNNIKQKIGFFTTFFIEALDPDEAKKVCIKLLNEDKKLKEMTLNSNNDLPNIIIDELIEIIDWPKDAKKVKIGYSFYNEES